MYSHYLHAISIVCRSIRSNNGSNHTITAGLHSMHPVESILQSIAWGQAQSAFLARGPHFSEYLKSGTFEDSATLARLFFTQYSLISGRSAFKVWSSCR